MTAEGLWGSDPFGFSFITEMIKDLAVLQKDPFASVGSVAEVFGSDVKLWGEIMKTIETINDNAYFSNETRAYADRSF